MKSKTLHIFNPEHDIALASNLANFTAPHAGRELRADLGYLPVLWAEEGDMVLVDNVDYAMKAYRNLRRRIRYQQGAIPLPKLNIHFAAGNDASIRQATAVNPWGWDKTLTASLKRKGIDELLMPDDDRLDMIRRLSHRRTSAQLLPMLQQKGTVGESYECTRPDEVEALLARYGQVVMKAPWSSSGRGLRFLSSERTPFKMQAGWFRNVVAVQGSVMVEPFYNKVKDFGMEFYVEEPGKIRYLGLSLFHTANGAYVGNILATEKTKYEYISRYIPVCLIDAIKQDIMSFKGLESYTGPFGVDMMVVAGEKGFLLHPCVEINLRRTMGHAALALTPVEDGLRYVMRIEVTNDYKLRINKL